MGHSSGKSSLDSSIRRKSENDKEFPLPKCVPCLIGSGEAVKHRGLQSWPRRNMVHLYHGQWSACIMEGDGDALPCLKWRPLPRNDRGTSTKTGGQVGVLLGTRMYDDAPVLQKGFYQVGAVRAGPAPQVAGHASSSRIPCLLFVRWRNRDWRRRVHPAFRQKPT